MNRLKKLINNLSVNQNKSTINVLNNDCIQQIIKKLSINEMLKLEKVDKRFQFCVKEVLKQQKVLCFGEKLFCKHSAINSNIYYFETFINFNEIKAVLKKCPNIECLQMREIIINKSLIEWISNNCKQLVCIHLFDPRSETPLREIGFKQIAKLLSDKIEIEIIFGDREYDTEYDAEYDIEYDREYHLSQYSIIAFMQNMPQIKDISFRANAYYNIRELIPCFGHNIRSLSIENCNTLSIEDLNAIKNNTNLVELRLYSSSNTQQIFDFICDNLTQLKSFGFGYQKNSNHFSLIQILNLINLEKFYLRLAGSDVHFLSTVKNKSLNKLQAIELSDTSITPTMFANMIQMCRNIEIISINYLRVFCEHNQWKSYCFECVYKSLECLSKLNRLKVLEINDENYGIIKAIVRLINEQTFERLEELSLFLTFNMESLNVLTNYFRKIFVDLIESLFKLCDRNPKKLFTFKTYKQFNYCLYEKQSINGIKYRVFVKEVPKNMRIIICR
jgi:hypothetical protein